MRNQPLVNGYSSSTHIKTSTKDDASVGMPNELGVKLPPISQVDCLGLHRVDVDAITKEREDKMARLRIRHKRISTGPRNEREFGFGRRKKKATDDVIDGKAPPISQIGMGSQFEVPWWQTRAPQRNINSTRLLPMSQVSCLMYSPEKDQPQVKKAGKRNFQARFGIHESDSEYVKLAKSGGQRGLLHYVEATPPLKRTLDSKYSPGTNGLLPKSTSVQDPVWRPSQWATLSPITKKDHHDDSTRDKKSST